MRASGSVVANLGDDERSSAHVDQIGFGAGVVVRVGEVLGSQADRVKGINVAEQATDPERFANKRAEGYWRLRKVFESQQIMVRDDDERVQELTGP